MLTSRKMAHGRRCPYCDRPMDRRNIRLAPTRDHFVPECRGGRQIVICCNDCNGIKADKMPDEWAAYMAENPGWWLLTKAERRRRARGIRETARTIKWGPRADTRQGSPRVVVVVPPELIGLPPFPRDDEPPAPEGTGG